MPDGDGDADGRDFLIWQRNYGQGTAAKATTVVATQAVCDTPEVAPLVAEVPSVDAAFAEAGFAGLPDTLLPSTLSVVEELSIAAEPVAPQPVEEVATDSAFALQAIEDETTESEQKLRSRETHRSRAMANELGTWDFVAQHGLGNGDELHLQPVRRPRSTPANRGTCLIPLEFKDRIGL